MTEPRFEELINLYLDNEIGRNELGELKNAMRDNVLRRQKFERACQLHQAARKALTTRGAEATPEGEPATSDFRPTSSVAASSGQRSHSTGAAMGGPEARRNKQTQARRNASVPTMAERQLSKGAASSVDLSKVSLESSRSLNARNFGPTITFFDSPLGMLMAAIFTIAGVLTLYLLLKAAVPEAQQAGNTPSGDSKVSSDGSPIDQKELLRELQKGPRGAANPVEALHATIYQAAAGQPASDMATASQWPGNTNDTTAKAESSSSSVDSSSIGPALPTTVAPPANDALLMVNSTQLQVKLPPVTNIPGTQSGLTNATLPPVTMPTVGTGNQDKAANDLPP